MHVHSARWFILCVLAACASNSHRRTPDDHAAWHERACAAIEREDWVLAADAIAKAVKLAPGNPTYHLVYGFALYEKDLEATQDQPLTTINYEKSQYHLEQALALDGTQWRAYHHLARMHRGAGKTTAAAAAEAKANETCSVGCASPKVCVGESEDKD